MNLITEHRTSRNNRVLISFHEFLVRYKKNNNKIYGFVEGKDDIFFYRGFIEHSLPDNWNLELWWAGGKDNVYAIYHKLDWRRFKKTQILFFIDRDLSEITGEKITTDLNIYITDNYSIENDVVNYNTCDRVLREICGFSEISHNSADRLKILFESQFKRYHELLVPIMSHITLWRKRNINACLDNICMKHLFKFKRGVLTSVKRPKNKENLVTYIYDQCNCDLKLSEDKELDKISKLFTKKKINKRYCRGKYLFWFLVEFCLSIYRDKTKLRFLKNEKKPRMVVNLSHSNAFALIAPRARVPKSLNDFFVRTLIKHVESNS